MDYTSYIDRCLVKAIPNGDFVLLDYTAECEWNKMWDEHTRAARGLVMHKSSRIVARPFPKFFNLNDHAESQLSNLPRSTPELAEKLDGSLCIAWHDPFSSRWRITTRRSWQNPQIEAATRHLSPYFKELDPRLTHCFELTADWNRIVVLYPEEKLTLIGLIDTETGQDYSYAHGRDYARERMLSFVPFESAPVTSINLSAKVDNKEGYVARFPNGLRVKLKYDQYFTLHKIVTGLSVRGIWEMLRARQGLDTSALPPEFVKWYRDEVLKMQSLYKDVEAKALQIFRDTGERSTRKEYAAEFTRHWDLAGVLFKMLDKQDYSDVIWKNLRPEHKTFKEAEL
jgi:RNA ligase